MMLLLLLVLRVAVLCQGYSVAVAAGARAWATGAAGGAFPSCRL